MGTWLNEILFIVSVMVTRLDPFHLETHEQHLLELLSIKWWEGLRLSVCHTAGVRVCGPDFIWQQEHF